MHMFISVSAEWREGHDTLSVFVPAIVHILDSHPLCWHTHMSKLRERGFVVDGCMTCEFMSFSKVFCLIRTLGV